MARFAFKLLVQVLLVFLLTTMLLVQYLNKYQDGGQSDLAVKRLKAQIKEELRLQKLKDLQQTIFLKLNRPPDKSYNLNISLSEKLPLDRDIPDSRPKQCASLQYDYSKLPKTTVIMPIYNEALSMILRTVTSILNRTPASILEEVILVDDNSSNEDLQGPLESYVKLLPKVKLIRTPKREGLIRARLIGANLAKGEVLFFEDAHMENNVGWLEPLLLEIVRNPAVIIQPSVDQIEQWSLQYLGAANIVPRGGFSWDLRYTWMQMPEHEKKRLDSETEPFRTPTLVGCSFAVQKEYFFKIGSFDEGMNIWGGENIEVAFRNWLCGGEVLTHPCSRIAHAFKPFAYKFDGDREKIVQKNQMRFAELFMGDYKKFFYAATWPWKNKRIFLDDQDRKDLAKREELKVRLQCKDFEWYMKNIIPEMPVPPLDAAWFGEVASMASEACWYVADSTGYVLLTYFCYFHRVLPENHFYIDTKARLKFRNKCVNLDRINRLLKTGNCADPVSADETWELVPLSEQWGVPNEVMMKLTFRENGVVQTLCAIQVTNINTVHKGEQMPQLLQCDTTNKFSQWRWTYQMDYTNKFPRG